MVLVPIPVGYMDGSLGDNPETTPDGLDDTPSSRHYEMLAEACSDGDAIKLKKLLALGRGGKRKAASPVAFHWAAGGGQLECMSILLEAGMDINESNQSGR
jgi:hypothetical protein